MTVWCMYVFFDHGRQTHFMLKKYYHFIQECRQKEKVVAHIQEINMNEMVMDGISLHL